MKGIVNRPNISFESKLEIFDNDVRDLKERKVIGYSDICSSDSEIPNILLQIINGKSCVKYYPKNAFLTDITTCWIKLGEDKFKELLLNCETNIDKIKIRFSLEYDS